MHYLHLNIYIVCDGLTRILRNECHRYIYKYITSDIYILKYNCG